MGTLYSEQRTINIAICKASSTVCKKVEEMCEMHMNQLGLQFSIIKYATGEDVLTGTDSDILILGIDLLGINGIALKKQLQYLNRKCLIIYLTNHEEWMLKAFGRNVIGFVIENQIQNQFYKVLNNAVETVLRQTIVEGYPAEDILYIRIEHVYCTIVLWNGTARVVRKSGVEMEEILEGTNLIRVHRSYLVNMIYIRNLCDREITLSNSEKIPVSTRKLAQVKRRVLEFQKGLCLEQNYRA